MKKLFVALLAVAGLTACFNEEVVNVADQRTPISFDSFVDKATRSEDPSTTTESLAGFDVWGFMNEVDGKVFENEDVTKRTDGWGYDNTQYWTPGNDYYFAAVAPMNSANVVVDTKDASELGLGVIGFTNVDGTEDLLYSAVGPIEAPALGATTAQKVQFQFNHLLSKVRFSFTNGFNNELAYIKVTNIRMEVPQTAKLAVNTADWWVGDKWAEHAGNIVLEFGDMENPEVHMNDKTYSAYERLTIPAAATQSYNVIFDVELYMGTVLAYSNTMTTTIEGVALQMGKAYNFHATINHENITPDGTELLPIEFDVIEVKNWETEVEYNGGVIETNNAVATEDELVAAVAAGLDVVLAKDIELTQTLTFGAVTRAAEVAEYTLDLNGKTLKNANTTGETDVIIVAAGAKLTICGEGVVEAVTGGDGYAVISEGELVINGGTYKSGVDANNEPNAVVYARGNGKVFVNGGYFPNDNVSKYVLNKKDADRATTVIEVRGGKFENFDPANNAAENAGTNFVAEGYFSLRNGNVYEVVELAGNITLADNVVLSAPLLVKNDLTINLNSFNISSASDVFEVAAGTLNIVGEGEIFAATDNGEPYCAVWAYGNAVVNIYGGEYKIGFPEGDYNDLIYAKDNAKINIYGGKYYNSGRENSFVLNLKDGSAADINVYGGAFEKFNPANNNSEGANTNFVAAGFKAVQNGDWFDVVAAK